MTPFLIVSGVAGCLQNLLWLPGCDLVETADAPA
jgi:hypothetical protein